MIEDWRWEVSMSKLVDSPHLSLSLVSLLHLLPEASFFFRRKQESRFALKQRRALPALAQFAYLRSVANPSTLYILYIPYIYIYITYLKYLDVSTPLVYPDHLKPRGIQGILLVN